MMKIKFFSAMMLGSVAQALQLKQWSYAQNFAQLEADTHRQPTCLSTSERIKTPVDKFYELYGAAQLYEDNSFQPSSQALFWANMGEQDGSMAQMEKEVNIQWKRVVEAYPNATLFGQNGISPADLKIGFIGNSWFVSALAALAEFPGRIEKIFLNNHNELSRTGIYGINLYTLGFPQTIIVDDFLPLQPGKEQGKYTTLYADLSNEAGIWGPIFEKALAKRFGNYEHIVSGVPSDAIRALTGSPFYMFEHKKQDVETLWQLLNTHDRHDDFITCGTEGYDDKSNPSSSGLDKGHAYVVLGTIKLNNGIRLVKIRSPWGSEGINGVYSDTDAISANAIQDKSSIDGTFFLEIDTYLSQFSETQISYDVSDWANARFLKLDDKSHAENPGNWEGVCGSTCTRHTMTLKADVAQTIYLTAYTWGEMSIPDNCEKSDNNLFHAIVINKVDNVFVWNFGDYNLEPIRMTAGETVKIEMEWNFTNDAHAKDWSLVAYGDGRKGSLHLTHD